MFSKVVRVVRGHPRTIVLVLVLALLTASGGLYAYTQLQLNAARSELEENRAADARARLDSPWLWVWPHAAEFHFLAARAARLTAHYDEAEAHLQECKKLEHGTSEAVQLEYLLMRAQMGEEDEVAGQLINLVDQKHPESLQILETLARANMSHLRYGPAYDCLTRWIEAAPHSATPLRLRGWVLEQLGHHVEVMIDYKKALKLDPELDKIRLRIAEMLLADKRPKEALPHLLRLRKQFPNRPDVLARLGQCCFLQGRSKDARRLLEAAVKKLPHDSAVLLHLAKLDVQDRRPAQAERWCRLALQVDPHDIEALYNLSQSLNLRGRASEAQAVWKQYKQSEDLLDRIHELQRNEARSVTPDPKALAELGVLLLRYGREPQGLYHLDQALLHDPGNRRAHKAFADYYDKKGEREKAAVHRRWLDAPEK